MISLRRVRSAVLFVAAWAGGLSCALAQPPASPQKTSYDYSFAYGLVILGVMLGLLCVLRPSGRRREAKPQQYVSKNILVEEDK
ncbi:MAG: hypothetical protein ABR915_22060 [Thermoguttaceae bacterium]|jgi:hypothetical protein